MITILSRCSFNRRSKNLGCTVINQRFSRQFLRIWFPELVRQVFLSITFDVSRLQILELSVIIMRQFLDLGSLVPHDRERMSRLSSLTSLSLWKPRFLVPRDTFLFHFPQHLSLFSVVAAGWKVSGKQVQRP